jgi:hypothetical protein
MSARSGSLGWVVLAGAVSVGIASAMWGLFDARFVDTMLATDSWAAPDGSTVAIGREYVITAWDWLLLIVVLRVGLEAIVSSRITAATTMLPFATIVLIISHLLVVLWMLTIPEMAQPLYDLAMNDYSSALAALPGTETAVTMGYEYGIGILPAVLLVVADGWYLSAPIRNDMLGRSY